ncbi:hypothetical protein HMPREF0742_02557 [Rothia aeria F0184]|uniref:Uncharacterized protein n=1 Tax=Rothia aeria F0184 TaxID=888019 RepID=U7UX68_9MICC|nr:hypothetical protein HMPREF0742_02557 [Rothia aeria F0184]
MAPKSTVSTAEKSRRNNFNPVLTTGTSLSGCGYKTYEYET